MSLLGFELGSPGLQIQHLTIELVRVPFKPDSTTLSPSQERVIFDSSRVPSPQRGKVLHGDNLLHPPENLLPGPMNEGTKCNRDKHCLCWGLNLASSSCFSQCSSTLLIKLKSSPTSKSWQKCHRAYSTRFEF